MKISDLYKKEAVINDKLPLIPYCLNPLHYKSYSIEPFFKV